MHSKDTSWKRQFIFDITVVLVILLLPFSVFIHLIFSEELEHLVFASFEYKHGFPNNQVFAWYILTNFINLIYLFLIFFFTRGAWRLLISPAIYHFIAYPLWMFASEAPTYLDFVFNWSGLILMLFYLAFIRIVDQALKRNTRRENIKLSNNHFWREIIMSWNQKFNREVTRTIENKAKLSLKEYIHRIYYLTQLTDNKTNKITLLKRQNSTVRIFGNYFLGLLIIALMGLLVIHNFVPQNLSVINLGDFQIESFGFKDVKTLVWYTSQKFVLVMLAIIWFGTSFHWWRWAILSPIIFYSYQFWEGFQTTSDIESSGNLSVFPFVFMTIVGVLVLSKVIRRVSINLDYQVFLEEELEKGLVELSRGKTGSLAK
jgi:hypothetical protein